MLLDAPPLDSLPPEESPEVAVGGGPLVGVVGLPVTVVPLADGFSEVLMPPESPVDPGPVVLEVLVSVSEVSPSLESHAETRRTQEAKEIQRRCMGEPQATPCFTKTSPDVG